MTVALITSKLSIEQFYNLDTIAQTVSQIQYKILFQSPGGQLIATIHIGQTTGGTI